jgi:hypothetical protein
VHRRRCRDRRAQRGLRPLPFRSKKARARCASANGIGDAIGIAGIVGCAERAHVALAGFVAEFCDPGAALGAAAIAERAA